MFARSLVVALVVVAGVSSAQADWTVNVLNRFVTEGAGSNNGYNPRLGVLLDGGDMIGSTNLGGKGAGGVVYRRSTNGKVKPLYSFVAGDTKRCGYNPSAKLVMAPDGTIYGTTFFGGEGGGGVIFALSERSDATAEWKCSPLKSFFDHNVNGSERRDGYSSFGGLLMVGARLYGTAQSGGLYGGGVIFLLNTNNNNYKVLYNFNKSGKGGYGPAGALAMDSTGAFFGATFFGGAGNAGVIFKLTPSGSRFGYRPIHAFGKGVGKNGARLGYQPTQGPLLIDPVDNLYGATTLGGCPQADTITPACTASPAITPAGVLFKLTPTGGGDYGYTVLHTFDSDESGSANGYGPYGGLIRKGSVLFGVAQSGGSRGGGIAFQINNSGGSYKVLRSFDPDNEGYTPSGALTRDGSNLLGTNQNGGGGAGTLFELQPP